MPDIKTNLLKIIRNEKIDYKNILQHNIYCRSDNIEEFTTEDLIGFTTFFIEAYFLDQEKQNVNYIHKLLNQFFEECDYYNIVPKKYIKMKDKIIKSGFSREEKIFFFHEKQLFKSKNVDWDSREWVIELLSYFYILSIELYNFNSIESRIKEESKPVIKKNNNIKFVQIDSKGLRKNILVDRNAPQMSLDDFANKLLANNNLRNSSLKNHPKYDEEDVYEQDLQKLRENDDFRDEIHTMKGNTLGKG